MTNPRRQRQRQSSVFTEKDTEDAFDVSMDKGSSYEHLLLKSYKQTKIMFCISFSCGLGDSLVKCSDTTERTGV